MPAVKARSGSVTADAAAAAISAGGRLRMTPQVLLRMFPAAGSRLAVRPLRPSDYSQWRSVGMRGPRTDQPVDVFAAAL